MKLGDKVRFLNETGGGIITGFIGKNLVNVENEDGFEIPMPIQEVVVIDTNSYNIPQPSQPSAPETQKPTDRESEPADTPITFKPMVVERKGGERINLFLCAVPVSELHITESDMELYFINDCNYYVDFTFLTGENNSWEILYRGTAEPNTKEYMLTLDQLDLNKLENICIQCICYKQNKPFLLMPAYSIRLKPDLSKFFKLHTFQPNDFFDEKVQTFPLVLDNIPK